MYKIQKREWGIQLVFSGPMDSEEWENWLEDSKKALKGLEKPFSVVVDLRNLELMDKKVQEMIILGQQFYREKGMQRSAVILNSAINNLRFQRIARESGIYEHERYIDAWLVPNWRAIARNWAEKGIEPPD